MILTIALLFLACIFVVLVAIPYYKYLQYRRYGKGQFTPIIGEITQLEESLNKYDDIEYLLHHQLDKDPSQRLYVVNLGTKIKLRIFEPELVKEFYMNQQHYVKDQTFIGNLQRFIREGIVAAEGATWKNSRRIFSQAFHYDYLQKLAPLIEGITENVLKEIVENNQMDDFDSIINMQEITGRVIIATFFGETLENESFRGVKIIQALSYVLNTLGNQTLSPQYFIFGSRYFELGLTQEHRKFNDFLEQFDLCIQAQINKKIEDIQNEIKSQGSTKNPCILAQLINSSQIDQISREQLYQDFKTFYLAGMDTTGHLLGMTIYYATQNQEMYKTLQQEIDNNKDQSAHGLSQLPYMNAVIKETLRYYGPGNILFDRIATSDHTLCGIPIKKGTIVTPYAVTMHRNPNVFEDPHTYNPQRWLNNQLSDLHSYGYIPFSAGQRNCIGQHLAYLEARIILNAFVKRFDFSCPSNYKLIMGYKFLAEPVKPLALKLKLRNKSQ